MKNPSSKKGREARGAPKKFLLERALIKREGGEGDV